MDTSANFVRTQRRWQITFVLGSCCCGISFLCLRLRGRVHATFRLSFYMCNFLVITVAVTVAIVAVVVVVVDDDDDDDEDEDDDDDDDDDEDDDDDDDDDDDEVAVVG